MKKDLSGHKSRNKILRKCVCASLPVKRSVNLNYFSTVGYAVVTVGLLLAEFGKILIGCKKMGINCSCYTCCVKILTKYFCSPTAQITLSCFHPPPLTTPLRLFAASSTLLSDPDSHTLPSPPAVSIALIRILRRQSTATCRLGGFVKRCFFFDFFDSLTVSCFQKWSTARFQWKFLIFCCCSCCFYFSASLRIPKLASIIVVKVAEVTEKRKRSVVELSFLLWLLVASAKRFNHQAQRHLHWRLWQINEGNKGHLKGARLGSSTAAQWALSTNSGRMKNMKEMCLDLLQFDMQKN